MDKTRHSIELDLLPLVEQSKGSIKVTIQAIEILMIKALMKHSPKDEQDKDRLIQIYRALDTVAEQKLKIDAFTKNTRLQQGYEQVQKAKASLVFDKGLGRLQEVREAIWSEVPSNG